MRPSPESTSHKRSRWLGVVLLAAACGPIPSPPPAADLREDPTALAREFDADAGRYRLLLLLSPA